MQRVTEAARKGGDTAPGPSGLTYAMLQRGSDSMRGAFAHLLEACQRTTVRPGAWRRAHEYPVPKLGAGGATLEGAVGSVWWKWAQNPRQGHH